MYLLYGLQTSWLTKVQRTKLDGFQAKCVRKICGVQHSYWSRITNAEVLSYVDVIKLSDLLLEQQLLVFGKIFRKPVNDVLRKAIFEEESDTLKLCTKTRKRGRPKLAWSTEVRKIALLVTADTLTTSMGDGCRWKNAVRKFCRAPCSTPPGGVRRPD